MTSKIFKSVFFASLIVLLISFALVLGVLYEYSENRTEQQLKGELSLVAEAVQSEGEEYLNSLPSDTDIRITWIDSDGTVLYDNQESDVKTMKNHLGREEVQEAVQNGYGESRRYSSTLMERLLYSAQRLDNGTIIRLAVSQNSVFALILGMLQPFCVILGIAVLLSLFFAHRMAERIVKPINNLDLEHPLENTGYDELTPIFKKIHRQQIRLASQKEDLYKKQTELDAVLENMQEGMILLASDGHVISINDAARKILQIPDIPYGKTLLQMIRNLDLEEMVRSAEGGHMAEKILSFDDRQYEVIATPVKENLTNTERGITIVFFDVTERERAEQLRREFTANVSHELKTPLHSISGYAELMKDGVVKDSDISLFSGKIYTEAQRMSRMIQDIITLSHLDEGADEIPFQKTDLYECAKECVSRLESQANERNISFTLHGEKTVINAKPALITQIMMNLCENAIKYNHSGGSVDLFVEKKEDSSASIIVSDTGIGIPKADQERIFERFYRVDKSHSREIGGTGLGLSIVKHAVLIHHGKVTLKSTPGEGTTVTVTLPVYNSLTLR